MRNLPVYIKYDNNSYASSTGTSITIPPNLFYWEMPKEKQVQYPGDFLEMSARETIAHEVQHCIQSIEGWEGGRPCTNWEYISKRKKEIPNEINIAKKYVNYSKEELKKAYLSERENGNEMAVKVLVELLLMGYTPNELISDLQKELQKLENKTDDEYYDSLGEKEAYAVSNRIKLTPDQRRQSLMK